MQLIPESIDIALLPSVELSKKSQLPKTSAVYFAIDSSGVVQYIGATKNLNQRWSLHHRLRYLKNLGGVKIAYFNCETKLLNEIEKALIDWFQPPLNTQSIKRTCKKRGIRIRYIKEIEVENLGEQIKQLRLAIASSKSLDQLCDEVGVSRTYWYEVEKETLMGALSLENLRKIEKALGVNLGVNLEIDFSEINRVYG